MKKKIYIYIFFNCGDNYFKFTSILNFEFDKSNFELQKNVLGPNYALMINDFFSHNTKQSMKDEVEL
jgi:hypothetical protein